MKVTTLRAHQNHFGTKYSKATGDEYEHPSPETDIKFGYVAAVDAKHDGDDKSAPKATEPKAKAGSAKA